MDWYHPGEVVLAAQVPARQRADRLSADLLRVVGEQLPAGALGSEPRTRTVVFSSPARSENLAFVFLSLADQRRPEVVRDAVSHLHSRFDQLGRGRWGSPIGAMPHWHCSALFMGPSPGTEPRPIYQVDLRGASRHHYAPASTGLSATSRSRAADRVPVIVLDTAPDWGRARQRAREVNNPRLAELVDRLATEAQPHEPQAFDRAHPRFNPRPESAEPGIPIADHGLFIAGLINDVAPGAPLELRPVLSARGGSDLYVILSTLANILANKKPTDPLVLNASFGLMPHPEHLPAIWYGLPHPADDVAGRASQAVDRSAVDLLDSGVDLLMHYLQENNCLLVAAAGNDSLRRVERHRTRLGPRLPARYESVLGVAATTSDPEQPAAYSNVGDELELGDHVAAFGGNATERLEPEDGVIGLYSGEFPRGQPNETGWARWSGTSFATAFVSGIAANLWSRQPTRSAAEILLEVHAQASRLGPYVPELRTPAIAIRGAWD